MKQKLKLFIGIIVLVVFLPTISFGAEMSGTATPFGGKINISFYCNCSNSYFLAISDIRTDQTIKLAHMLGISRLNLNYNIYTPGIWTLGNYISGGQCRIYVYEECIDIEVDGQISPSPMAGIGTGATP